MTLNKLVKRNLKRILILIIIVAAVACFMSAASTILSNHLALTQMENSDSLFIIFEMYNKFMVPSLSVALVAFIIYRIYVITSDIYQYIKNKEDIKGENNNEKECN